MEPPKSRSDRIRYLRRIRSAVRGYKSLAQFAKAREQITRDLAEIQSARVRAESQRMFKATLCAAELAAENTPHRVGEALRDGMAELIDYLEANEA